jgi:hypothetical protein
LYSVGTGTFWGEDGRERLTSEVRESMPRRLRKRTLSVRTLLAYAAVATSAFAVAAGVGAMAFLIIQGGMHSPTSEKPRPSLGQGNAERDDGRQSEAQYVGEVGDIQSRAVQTSLDSHDKLLRYDVLTAEDVEELKANQSALEGLTDQVDNLSAPQSYEEQYRVFSSAIDELHEAAKLAYGLAADPVAAAESGFEGYDARLEEAAPLLERSNELLGRDYDTVEGVREISPQF